MNTLIKTTVSITSLVFAGQAFALSDSPGQTTASQSGMGQSRPGFHLVLNGGFSFGGDTIVTAVYTDGTTSDINAGSMMQVGIGGLYQFEDKPIAVMLSANYHFDSAVGSNGDITFSRFPIEALAYYTGKEKFRFGGGLRIVNGPELTASIDGYNDSIVFDSTTGYVAEVGHQLSPQGWLNFRYVVEEYKANSIVWNNGAVTSLVGVAPLSGSHMGINFSYEF